MAILVTGGAGYIGSHTVVELLNANKEVVVLDNLCNSSPKSIEREKEITGKDVKFYEGDILNRALLQKIFAENTKYLQENNPPFLQNIFSLLLRQVRYLW